MIPDTRAGMKTSPATKAIAITPNNNNDLAFPIRMLSVGVVGTVSFVGIDGKTYTTGELPVGNYPVVAKRIRSTGTTAASLTGWA